MTDFDKQIADLKQQKKEAALSEIKAKAYTVKELIADLGKLPPETVICRLADYEPAALHSLNLYYDERRGILYDNEWHEVRWYGDEFGGDVEHYKRAK